MFDDLKFTTAPEDQGQIITVSYAADWENEQIIKHVFDGSDRSEYYETADACEMDGDFEPHNGADNLRALDWTVID